MDSAAREWLDAASASLLPGLLCARRAAVARPDAVSTFIYEGSRRRIKGTDAGEEERDTRDRRAAASRRP
jgi:hypothetical protein